MSSKPENWIMILSRIFIYKIKKQILGSVWLTCQCQNSGKRLRKAKMCIFQVYWVFIVNFNLKSL